MSNLLARNWWAVALRGVLAIVFGVLALRMPATALIALVLLFGFYALVDGAVAIVSALSTAGKSRIGGWW